MSSTWGRLSVVALATVCIVVSAAVPVAAATTGATSARPVQLSAIGAQLRAFVEHHGAHRAVPLETSHARFPSAHGSVTPNDLCLADNFSDPYGDAGVLDAAAYAIGYDCPSKTWSVVAADPTGIPPDLLDSFTMFIDRDRNAGTGCSGADVAVAVIYDAGSASFLNGAVETPNCDTNSWTTRPEPVGYAFPDSNTVGLAFPNSVINSGTFNWLLLLSGVDGNSDLLPDNGWQTTTTPVTATPPGPPIIGNAKAGDGRVAVAFHSPSTNGGSAITSYTADCRSSGGSSEKLVTGPGSPITVTQLVNGASYRCRVIAHNAIGTGAWSDWSNAVTPAAAPTAPTVTDVAGSNNQVTVAFAAPSSNGGLPITSYRADCQSSDFGAEGTVDGHGSPIVVTGLTNNDHYNCRVYAVNAMGRSAWSQWSSDVVPMPSAPAVPTAVHAVASDSTVTVSFAPPLDDGGSAITSYDVTLQPDGTTQNVADANSPVVFAGLDDGTSYSAAVVAHNDVGAGDTATSNTVVPSGITSQGVSPFHNGPAINVNGKYQDVAGDFNGDGRGDVIWYAPGGAPDAMWFGTASGGFVAGPPLQVNGVYDAVVGDFNGDGKSDVLWYAPGPAPDYLARGSASGLGPGLPFSVNGTYEPVVGDYNGDGKSDLLWYAAGARPDSMWLGAASGFSGGPPINVNGDYDPAAGDFNGDGYTDVLWYAPGTAADYLWHGGTNGFANSVALSINGRYQHLVGDFDGDGYSDVVWYAPGVAGDYFWHGGASGFDGSVSLSINGSYQGLPEDINGDGRSDLLWYAAGDAPDTIWLGGA